MILPADFMPIEPNGMSVITALVLFFVVVGGLYFIRDFKTCDTKQEKRLEKHEEIINDLKVDIADIKGDTKELRTGVGKIENSLTDMLKMNQEEISDIRKTYQDILMKGYKSD